MKANKYKLLFTLSFALCCTFSSCKKPSDSTTPSNTFLKEFGNWVSPFSVKYIREMPDNGYLLVGSNTKLNPTMIRVNKYGNISWSRSMINDTFQADYIIPSSDGNFVTNSINKYQVSKIDTNGNLLKSNQYINGLDNYNSQSPVIYVTNGYLISTTNGQATGNPSTNFIIQFDKNLNELGSITFNDYPLLGGKTLSFNVYNENPSGGFYVWGIKFTAKKLIWSNNEYLYAEKVSQHKQWDIKVIDSANQAHYYSSPISYVRSDTGLISVAQRLNYDLGNTTSVFVASLDKDLKILWQNSYMEGGSTINASSIFPCSDGGYIISGRDSVGTNSTKPFALKIDKNGNEQWSKIYTFPGTGQFNSGIELSEGGYLFAGSTVGFGNGKSNQTLLLKTDAKGNY